MAQLLSAVGGDPLCVRQVCFVNGERCVDVISVSNGNQFTLTLSVALEC